LLIGDCRSDSARRLYTAVSGELGSVIAVIGVSPGPSWFEKMEGDTELVLLVVADNVRKSDIPLETGCAAAKAMIV
jgi:hypothetical protein